MLSVSMLCGPVLASGNVSRERLEESRARQNADLLIVTGKLDGAEIGGLATLAAGVGVGIGAGVTYAVLHRKLVAQNKTLASQNERLLSRSEEVREFMSKARQGLEFAVTMSEQNDELETQKKALQSQVEKLEAEKQKLQRDRTYVNGINRKVEYENLRLKAINKTLQKEVDRAGAAWLAKYKTTGERLEDILRLEREQAAAVASKRGFYRLGDIYGEAQIDFLNQFIKENVKIPTVWGGRNNHYTIKEGAEKAFCEAFAPFTQKWNKIVNAKTILHKPKSGQSQLMMLLNEKTKIFERYLDIPLDRAIYHHEMVWETYEKEGIFKGYPLRSRESLGVYLKKVPTSTPAKSYLSIVGKKVVLKSLPAAVGVGLLGGAFAWANSQAQEQEILARVEENPSLWINLSDEDFERVVQSPKLAESYLAFNDALHELAQIPAAELQQALQDAQEYEQQQRTVEAQQLRRELTGRLAF